MHFLFLFLIKQNKVREGGRGGGEGGGGVGGEEGTYLSNACFSSKRGYSSNYLTKITFGRILFLFFAFVSFNKSLFQKKPLSSCIYVGLSSNIQISLF